MLRGSKIWHTMSFIEKLDSIERIPLAEYPTPLEYLPRLSTEFGHPIYIKRDDLLGLSAASEADMLRIQLDDRALFLAGSGPSVPNPYPVCR